MSIQKADNKETNSVDDPFYGKSNMQYLDKVIQEIENGTAKLTEHELMGADDE